MTVEGKVEGKQVEEVGVSREDEPKKVVEDAVKAADGENKESADESKLKSAVKSSSYREESNLLSDLRETERKALSELRSKLEDAILSNKLFKDEEPKKKESQVKEAPAKEEMKEKEEPKEGKQEKEKETEESKEAEENKEIEREEESKEKEEERVKEESKESEEKGDEDKTEASSVEAKEGEKKELKEGEAEEAKREGEEEKEGKASKETKEEGEEEKNKTEESTDTQGEKDAVIDRDISLWGVPLLPSKAAEGTDVVLLKFLRARDFKVNEAFEMLKKTLRWRKSNNLDSIADEDFGADLSSAAYLNGLDREGHPVCYNIHGVLSSEELYLKTFGTEESRVKFLRWRFQLMEKGIEKLDFRPDGVSSLLQIHDLKNTPGLPKKELRMAMKKAILSLQDNYPELVARNIFVNAPFWFYALNALVSPFLTQRSKSKFVVARPGKVTETLLKYIPAEQLPVQYGGFKRENDPDFSTGEDGIVSERIVKAGSTETIEIPADEAAKMLVWDITVLGWEVNYKEEFVPSEEGSYTVIVQKGKKMGGSQGPIRNTFRNSEAGKIVLTVENVSGRKKRILYRSKTKDGSSF